MSLIMRVLCLNSLKCISQKMGRPGYDSSFIPGKCRKGTSINPRPLPTRFILPLKKVKLSLCLTNEALPHEDVWGSGCIDPHVLDLGTSWRWVVSFMPWPLYPRGKSPPDTHCIGSWMGPRTDLDDVERKIVSLLRLEIRPLGRPARSQSLYRLSYCGSLPFIIIHIWCRTVRDTDSLVK
jgi:hypothetical protein